MNAPEVTESNVTLSAVTIASQIGTKSKGAQSSLRLRSRKRLTTLRLTIDKLGTNP